jgi:hypothetical protein
MQPKPKPDPVSFQGCPVDDLDEDEGYLYFIPSSPRREPGLGQAPIAALQRSRSPSNPPPAFLGVGYK